MRKRQIAGHSPDTPAPQQDWLRLEDLAEVEFTSEDAAHPIEAAFEGDGSHGWRSAAPGSQRIRLVFAQPQPIRLIQLKFVEPLVERTQQYGLRWSPDHGLSFQEIVRQQWHFSPSGATEETENHQVDLPQVTVLELDINPDIGDRQAVATLQHWRIA